MVVIGHAFLFQEVRQVIFWTHDALLTTHNDGRRPIAVDQLSDSYDFNKKLNVFFFHKYIFIRVVTNISILCTHVKFLNYKKNILNAID